MTAAELRAGDLLGADLIVEHAVGRGGTSIVYRARRAATGAAVAVKLLVGGHADRARIVREQALLAAIDDPRLARIVELGETDDGVAFAVLPWLDGNSLADTLVEPGVTAAEAVAMIAAAAAALAVAHRHGVVHRDLKPAHLWLGPDGAVAIIDFGIARGIGDDQRITRTGTSIGTPGYMAPEQIAGGVIAPPTDVFGLGCILYEALTGAPAFAGHHPAVLRGKVLWAEPPSVTERCPEADAALAALVAAMLAKVPAERPPDAAAVATALAAIAAPAAGPRRRSGHGEAATSPSTRQLVAVGIPLGATVADAAAPAVTLADRSAIARAPDRGGALSDGVAALLRALGPGRAIAIARTDDLDHGLRWCAAAASRAAIAATDGAEPAPILHDLTRDPP